MSCAALVLLAALFCYALAELPPVGFDVDAVEEPQDKRGFGFMNFPLQRSRSDKRGFGFMNIPGKRFGFMNARTKPKEDKRGFGFMNGFGKRGFGFMNHFGKRGFGFMNFPGKRGVEVVSMPPNVRLDRRGFGFLSMPRQKSDFDLDQEMPPVYATQLNSNRN